MLLVLTFEMQRTRCVASPGATAELGEINLSHNARIPKNELPRECISGASLNSELILNAHLLRY